MDFLLILTHVFEKTTCGAGTTGALFSISSSDRTSVKGKNNNIIGNVEN